jgi:phage-related tail protein
MAVVLTTAARVVTSAMRLRALTLAKRVAVLMRHAVVIASNSVRHRHTLGTVAITVVHLAKMHATTRDKTRAMTAPVKVAVVGKIAATTTAMPLAQPPVARPVTNLHVARSNLAPATSSPTALRAMALLANGAVHAS